MRPSNCGACDCDFRLKHLYLAHALPKPSAPASETASHPTVCGDVVDPDRRSLSGHPPNCRHERAQAEALTARASCHRSGVAGPTPVRRRPRTAGAPPSSTPATPPDCWVSTRSSPCSGFGHHVTPGGGAATTTLTRWRYPLRRCRQEPEWAWGDPDGPRRRVRGRWTVPCERSLSTQPLVWRLRLSDPSAAHGAPGANRRMVMTETAQALTRSERYRAVSMTTQCYRPARC